jgi:hypothetical protein
VNNTLRRALGPLSLSAEQVNALLDDPTLINSPSLGLTPEQRAGALAGYAKGFRIVFYVTVGGLLAAMAASAFMIGQHTLVREDDKLREEKAKEEERRRKEAKRRSQVTVDTEQGKVSTSTSETEKVTA